jgi:hypothetical protein
MGPFLSGTGADERGGHDVRGQTAGTQQKRGVRIRFSVPLLSEQRDATSVRGMPPPSRDC